MPGQEGLGEQGHHRADADEGGPRPQPDPGGANPGYGGIRGGTGGRAAGERWLLGVRF